VKDEEGISNNILQEKNKGSNASNQEALRSERKGSHEAV
jgi:hypothetical protein